MNKHQSAATPPILACQAVSQEFRDGQRTIDLLHDIHLKIAPGEQVAIVGASGAGKSTLLHILAGLDQPTTGNVCIAGQDVSKLSSRAQAALRNRLLGFIYQFHHLLPEFTVLENVCMPLFIAGERFSSAKKQATALLTQLGLAGRMDFRIPLLSGGEKQRVAFARALVNNPQCVLADEPTGNLDTETAAQVCDLMLNFSRKKCTSFLVVTHDQRLAKAMDRVLELSAGNLREICYNG